MHGKTVAQGCICLYIWACNFNFTLQERAGTSHSSKKSLCRCTLHDTILKIWSVNKIYSLHVNRREAYHTFSLSLSPFLPSSFFLSSSKWTVHSPTRHMILSRSLSLVFFPFLNKNKCNRSYCLWIVQRCFQASCHIFSKMILFPSQRKEISLRRQEKRSWFYISLNYYFIGMPVIEAGTTTKKKSA